MNCDALAPHCLRIRGGAEDSSGKISLDEGWTDGIYSDVLVSVIDGHAFGEQDDAPFEGAYDARLRAPLMPSTEATLMMDPPPAFLR